MLKLVDELVTMLELFAADGAQMLEARNPIRELITLAVERCVSVARLRARPCVTQAERH
jgi:hypothetical protein